MSATLANCSDYGSYAGHPMDPRAPEPTAEDDRREAIEGAALEMQCAEEARKRGDHGKSDEYAMAAFAILQPYFGGGAAAAIGATA